MNKSNHFIDEIIPKIKVFKDSIDFSKEFLKSDDMGKLLAAMGAQKSKQRLDSSQIFQRQSSLHMSFGGKK